MDVTVLTSSEGDPAHNGRRQSRERSDSMRIYRIVLTIILSVGLAGCIKLQMPDDLVSDTVDAIKGIDDDEPGDEQADDASTFSHSVVGAADTPEPALKQTCRSELESRTAELLGAPDVTFTLVSESVSVSGDKAIATCTVAIQQAAGQVSSASQ